MGSPLYLSAGGDWKKATWHQCTLYTFLQILEVNLFKKKPIFALATEVLKQIADSQEFNHLNSFYY